MLRNAISTLLYRKYLDVLTHWKSSCWDGATHPHTTLFPVSLSFYHFPSLQEQIWRVLSLTTARWMGPSSDWPAWKVPPSNPATYATLSWLILTLRWVNLCEWTWEKGGEVEGARGRGSGGLGHGQGCLWW